MSGEGEQGVRIGLSAVVMALRDRSLQVLTTHPDQGLALPFGPFDPARDRTFELSLRAFVAAQTDFRPGFVEQLYTFGDAGRDAPRATPGPDCLREVSVGYLALTREIGGAGTHWTRVIDIFPWEDRRHDGTSSILAAGLSAWAGEDVARTARVNSLFALAPASRWNEERVLERYELLYEAGLVEEVARDQNRSQTVIGPGLAMASDHRRILATALGRLRGKLKYRPVLFELTAQTFTLSELQAAAEAVAGLSLHKQNFRRGVERTGLVEPTGRTSAATGGRPAELYRFIGPDPQRGQALGLALPALR